MLLISGITATTLIWPDYFIDKLSQRYKVIIFDNRGAGKTDSPDEPYSMDLFVEDIVGLLDHLKLSKVHLYGESMGGMIAQNFILKHPERVISLLLAVTTPGKGGIRLSYEALDILNNHRKGEYNTDMWKYYQFLYTTEFFNSHKAQFENLLENPPDYPIQAPYAYFRQLEATIRTHDTISRLAEIKVPTLILVGMQDRLISPQNSFLLHEKIPNSRLIKYENVAHMYRFEASKCVYDILNFLDSINNKLLEKKRKNNFR